MFRESDYVPPRMHQSFKDRPVPEMQKRSQISQFDEVPERRQPFPDREADDVIVPSTYDTQYNPNHPDADWSGLVSKDRLQKRHTSGHRSQAIGLIQQEDGIISKQGTEAEFRHRTVQPKRQDTSSLIGGISAAGDQYKTTSHRQQNCEETSKDQLVLKKRVGSKKLLDPQYEVPHPDSMSSDLSNIQNISNQQREQASGKHYQFTPQGMGGKNLTSNLGTSLLSRVPEKPTPAPSNSNDVSKTLLLQNHKPLPGYTGRRPIN